MKRVLLPAAALFSLLACVSPPTSPWEIQVQFERSVRLLDGRATVAVRAESTDPAQVILNVQCGETSRTLSLAEDSVTPEVCGLQFEFRGFVLADAEPTAANFVVTWEEPAAE